MTTREEFERLVDEHASHGKPYALLDAWDRQATKLKRTSAVVKRLKVAIDVMEKARAAELTGVPLTHENAPRARVVETGDGMLWSRVHGRNNLWRSGQCTNNDNAMFDEGATVLAWRRT